MIRTCCTKTKFKPVSHVIFDMDGTILDTEGIYRKVLETIGEEYGKIYTDEMQLKIAGSILLDTAKQAIELMELPISLEDFLVKFEELANKYLTNCDFMPGAERMIRHLHSQGIPIAIATSSDQSAVDIKTSNHMEVFELFHHIVCGGSDPDVKMGKPHPDIFLVCASRFDDNPDPVQCLVIEDAINGVRGALSAGMQVVMIPDEKVPYELWKLATLRIDNFDSFIPELFGLPPFPDEVREVPEIPS